MVRIGAHDREGDPLTVASATGSEVVQFFLGDPQGWGAPTFPGGDAGKLRAALSEAGLEVVHPRAVRHQRGQREQPDPDTQPQTAEPAAAAAAAVGAKGLIVHGGHVTGGIDEGEGYANWRKAIERIERPVPLLIENTAGGDHAMARGLPALRALWDASGIVIAGRRDRRRPDRLLPGHLPRFASGEDLAGIVDRVKAITGRIDLVHCNNSRDEFGSGRDRHAAIESGTIEPELLLDVVRAAGAPAVSETPDPAADIAWLRERLTG